MRRFPILLAVLGLVVGIAGPLVWASPLPVLLGAALLVVAGALTRRGALVAVAIVAAAVLAFAPALVNGYRNGQGIAWTVPEDERLELAEEGLAVTRVEDEPVLRGRDLRTGERSWELRLRGTEAGPRLWRIGPRLLTTAFDETLRAVDVAGGKVQWESPGDVTFLGVTDGEYVAVTRCGETSAECEVQSLSLADGSVAWRAPAGDTHRYLGVPLPDGGAPQRDVPPWRASFVLVGDDERWTARDLATGRVLERGNRRDGYITLLGALLVRQDDEGALEATNVQLGDVQWKRAAGDGRASLSPIVSQGALALPEGRLVLSGDGYKIDSVRLGDRLRLLDPRTGELDEQPIDVEFDLVDVLASDRPTRRRPVVLWRDYDGDGVASRIIADGRVHDRDATRDVDVAPGLLGFGSDGRTWGTGLDRVYEVFDRDSGERIVRFAADEFNVTAYGDVLVVRTGEDDEQVQRVVVP